MNPIWFAVPAMCLYAIGNNFTSKYLRAAGPAANTLCIGLVMALVAGVFLGLQRANSATTTNLPSPNLWRVYVICGVMYGVADLLFYKAYSLHGSLTLLMTIVALMPVAAVVIEFYFFDGIAPSFRQSSGIALAVAAAWLVSAR